MLSFDRSNDDQQTPGFIALSDTLLLTTALLMTVAYGALTYSAQQATEIDGRETELQKANKRITALESENDELQAAKTQLEKKIAKLKLELEEALAEIARLKRLNYEDVVKDRDQLRQAVAALRAELDELKDKLKTAEALVTSLNKQLEDSRKEIASLKSQLTKVNRLVVVYQTENERLKMQLKKTEKQIDDFKTEVATLTKKVDTLETQVETLVGENRRLTQRNRILEKENADLKEKLRNSQQKNEDFEEILREQNDRIIKPLESARVIIRIWSEGLDDDLDLDLYVQDPKDRLCYFKKPRVLDKTSEHATLIPSEDLRFSNQVKAGRARTTRTEEVYYSSEPLDGSMTKPYLVFYMVRQTGKYQENRSTNIKLFWEITVKSRFGPARPPLSGDRVVTTTGAVVVNDEGEFYPGLLPLTGFRVNSLSPLRTEQLQTSGLPKLLRGWGEDGLDGGEAFRKLRDSN